MMQKHLRYFFMTCTIYYKRTFPLQSIPIIYKCIQFIFLAEIATLYALRAENQRKNNRRPNNTSGTNTSQHKSSGIELSLIARFIPKRHLIFKRTRKYSLCQHILHSEFSVSLSIHGHLFFFFAAQALSSWTVDGTSQNYWNKF